MVDMSIVISSFALLVSGIALFISWRTYTRDRSDIRINLEYDGQSGQGTRFNLRVINRGRRIAFIELQKLNFIDADPLHDSTAGGQPVGEGEVFDWWYPIFGMNGPMRDPTQIKSVEVFDTVGNRYVYPGFSLRNILEFRKLKTRIRHHWLEERKP